MKKTPSPGKFQRFGYIGSKSAEFVEGLDHSLTQKDSIGGAKFYLDPPVQLNFTVSRGKNFADVLYGIDIG